jgi:hypothetical protein
VLECRVPPVPEPQRVQWFRNEVEIHTSPDYEISYHAGVCTLVISECFPEDSGKFTCTVTVNGAPNSTTMFLQVEGELTQSGCQCCHKMPKLLTKLLAYFVPL